MKNKTKKTPRQTLEWMLEHLCMTSSLQQAIRELLDGKEVIWEDETMHHKEPVDLEDVLHLAGVHFQIERKDSLNHHYELIRSEDLQDDKAEDSPVEDAPLASAGDA